MTPLARSDNIVDNPDKGVAEHIREYVATDGRRAPQDGRGVRRA
jgi:hypothetical protein